MYFLANELLRGCSSSHHPSGGSARNPNGILKYRPGLIIKSCLSVWAALTSHPVANGSAFVGKNFSLSTMSSLTANLKIGISLIFNLKY